MSVRFTQSCPTCGRRVQVRASLLGYTVACQHCNAEFVAEVDGESRMGPLATVPVPSSETDPLMARVEEALQRASDQKTAVSVPEN